MKRNVNSVLRSRTGASLILALLLFLVCSVIAALVITAGTAAAGRASNLAEMDQRYYSVSSAARFLAAELDGGTVTITRTREVKDVQMTPYTVTVQDVGGVSRTVVTAGTTVSAKTADYHTMINDYDDIETIINDTYDPSISTPGQFLPERKTMSFLTSCAVFLLFDDSCNNDESMEASMKNGHVQSGEFILEHIVGDVVDKDKLKIHGVYSVKEDGTLVLTLQNANGEPYAMRVTLKATINETHNETTKESAPERIYDSSGGYKETVTKTTLVTKVSKITWKISGVEKAEAIAESEGG